MPSWAHKRKRPNTGALPNCIQSGLQAASLVGRTSRTLLELAIGIARGFHCLWDLAHEVDVQETVLEAGTLDLHVVGELEATFEVPRGDALGRARRRSQIFSGTTAFSLSRIVMLTRASKSIRFA